MIANWGMAAFLSAMAVMNAWNCWLLLRDKEVRGMAPVTVLFRSCANVWQVWFLYALHQWAAFGAAVPATAFNLAWVALAFHCRSRNNLLRQYSRSQAGAAGRALVLKIMRALGFPKTNAPSRAERWGEQSDLFWKYANRRPRCVPSE